MISEIYACGHGDVSSFVIVEEGAMVHYGSHRWKDFIDYDGVSVPVNDGDCTMMGVICGIMMCRDKGRRAVNVYTRVPLPADSPFKGSYEKMTEGMDVFCDRWMDDFYDEKTRDYYPNEFKKKCLELAGLTKTV